MSDIIKTSDIIKVGHYTWEELQKLIIVDQATKLKRSPASLGAQAEATAHGMAFAIIDVPMNPATTKDQVAPNE